MVSFYPRMVVLLAVYLATTACIGADIDEASEEFVEVEESAAVAENGFLANALSPALLSPNALSPSALSAIQDPGTRGNLSRELLRYIVGCALKPDQSFAFSWTDSSGGVHSETYRGELGLAHWWKSTSIANDAYVQRTLTACLASRVNWYGVSVMISLRGVEASSSTSERATYTVREGAFWGNVFTHIEAPYLQACYSPSGVARARQVQRDCAAGHINVNPVTGATLAQPCGALEIVGSCDAVCNGVDSVNGFYRGCIDRVAVSPWARTDSVITSFLLP
ncbi:hypothetical protein [Sorangium cellulosum]|nr:hypothetical protein [Sorangium cellulosum]